MIRPPRQPRPAGHRDIFRAAALAALLATSFVPAYAEPLATVPQSETDEPEIAPQDQLAYIETRIIAPLIQTHGPEKYGLGALSERLTALKNRADTGEDIETELTALQADANQAARHIANLTRQRNVLDDLEAREITPALNKPDDKYGRKELFRRSVELRRRLDAGEDVSQELAALQADAKRASAQSWNDYKAAQGWKW